MKAGMDRKTARKYVAAGKLPSEMAQPRDWRTREDPFAEDWPEVEALLRETPALEAKTLFEVLSAKYPGRYEAGQLRTLQRRVRLWRATQGPDREVLFAQQHRPGRGGADGLHVRPRSSASRSPASCSRTCSASSCCRTPIGSGRRSACPSRWRRCARACSVRSSSSDACRATTRPTTRRRRRTASPTERRRLRGRQAPLQRRVPRAHAALRDDAAHDGDRREGAKRRRRERATARSSAGSSRRSWCAAAATSTTSTHGSRFIDDVLRKANAGARTARRRGHRGDAPSSTSRSSRSSSRRTSASASGAPCGSSTARTRSRRGSSARCVRVRIFEDRIEVYFAATRAARVRAPPSAAICIASTTGTSSGRSCASPARSRATSTARRCSRRSSSAARTTRSRRRTTAPKGDLEYLRILHLAASTHRGRRRGRARRALAREGEPITSDAVKALVTTSRDADGARLAAPDVDLAAYDALLAEVGT